MSKDKNDWKNKLYKYYSSRKSLLSKEGFIFDKIDKTPVYEELENKNGHPILFVGEAPGKLEVKNRLPFQGDAGINLKFLTDLAEITNDQMLKTNLFPFRTYGKSKNINRTPKKSEIKAGSKLLSMEMSIVQPRIVVLLGESARDGAKNVFSEISTGNHFFQQIDFGSKKLIIGTTYHPSPINYNDEIKSAVMKSFFIKLKEISDNLPKFSNVKIKQILEWEKGTE